MAISKTKYQATNEEIVALFARHGIKGITEISPLGDGEFNAVYKVVTPENSYALKIAPSANAAVVNFEHDMMRSEVYWYGEISKHTSITIPQVIATDFTHQDIRSDCFIMTLLDAQPLWKSGLNEEQYARAAEKKIEMLTMIHRVKGERFGYVQVGLHDTWYAAIRSMTERLIADCEALGKKTPDGHKFLQFIDQHKATLEKAPCRLVNFDLWDSNVLYKDGELCWIDPERSFYGDPIADFITLGMGQKAPLDAKMEQIAIYNRTAEEKVTASREECIRYAIAVCYLALIEEVEKYFRYEPENPIYIRNTVDARDMYDMAFEVLA